MSQKTRWVVLDGGRDAGNYTGSWSTKNDWGDANWFMGTMYTGRTSATAPASMSFPFDGTEFILFGESEPPATPSGGGPPRWSCRVDEEAIDVKVVANPGRFSCAWKGNGTNPHTFHLSIDSVGSVSIDSIWFLPRYNSSRVENSYVVFNHDDPNVSKISGNWTTFPHEGENATLTTDPGSALSLTFTGARVYAEGWSPAGFLAGSSEATYSLNNRYTTGSFKVEPPNPPSETIHGRKLFETPTLQSPGELKNLTVTYKGPSAPLVLQRFFVKEGNFRMGDDPLAPEPSGGSSTSSNSGLDTIGNIIKIAVPSVAGFFVLMFLIGCFTGCFGRKKKPVASHHVDKDFELTQQPTPYTPPTYYPPHSGSGAHLMQPDQFQQPYYPEQFQQPYPPPPPPYQRPEVTQNLSGLSVDGGGQANVAGRDTNNITIHNLTIHPDAFNPPRSTL